MSVDPKRIDKIAAIVVSIVAVIWIMHRLIVPPPIPQEITDFESSAIFLGQLLDASVSDKTSVINKYKDWTFHLPILVSVFESQTCNSREVKARKIYPLDGYALFEGTISVLSVNGQREARDITIFIDPDTYNDWGQTYSGTSLTWAYPIVRFETIYISDPKMAWPIGRLVLKATSISDQKEPLDHKHLILYRQKKLVKFMFDRYVNATANWRSVNDDNKLSYLLMKLDRLSKSCIGIILNVELINSESRDEYIMTAFNSAGLPIMSFSSNDTTTHEYGRVCIDRYRFYDIHN